ncbi:hypothetical protein ACFLS5_01000 [Candidatus Bipolaricaulota bacterium]
MKITSPEHTPVGPDRVKPMASADGLRSTSVAAFAVKGVAGVIPVAGVRLLLQQGMLGGRNCFLERLSAKAERVPVFPDG